MDWNRWKEIYRNMSPEMKEQATSMAKAKVKEMLASIRPGDRVRTIGGIYGTITSVKDDYVVMQVGPDKIHLVFARGAISQIEEKGAENSMSESVVE